MNSTNPSEQKPEPSSKPASPADGESALRASQPEHSATVSSPPGTPSGTVPPDEVPQIKLSEGEPLDDTLPAIQAKIKTFLIGKPRDINDTSIFHHVTLVAFLAWVGLGADGLSSSCYGPPEMFHVLHDHSYLAVFLSLATIFTVVVISSCYSHIIEEFPSGGGGYLVASKLLGRPVGVISGCALLVDYVLTITVSVAAAGDALFGLIGSELASLEAHVRNRRHPDSDRAQSARR